MPIGMKKKKKNGGMEFIGKTIMSTEEWKVFFKENNYTGDYYWFIP